MGGTFFVVVLIFHLTSTGITSRAVNGLTVYPARGRTGTELNRLEKGVRTFSPCAETILTVDCPFKRLYWYNAGNVAFDALRQKFFIFWGREEQN
jgi:hypothetical protein